MLSFPDTVFQLVTSLLGVLVCSGGVSGSDNLDPVRVGDLHENSAAFGFFGRYRPDETLPPLLLLDRCEECRMASAFFVCCSRMFFNFDLGMMSLLSHSFVNAPPHSS